MFASELAKDKPKNRINPASAMVSRIRQLRRRITPPLETPHMVVHLIGGGIVPVGMVTETREINGLIHFISASVCEFVIPNILIRKIQLIP